MTDYHLGILLGASTALTFTFQGLWSRSVQRIEGPVRYVCYASIVPALVSVISWIFFPPIMHWPVIQAALILAPIQFLGTFAMGLAFSKGDVSMVTPIFGSKPLLVTLLGATLALEPATPSLWLASIVVFIALYLLNGKREVILRPWLVLQPVVLLVIAACTCFGISDFVTKHYVTAEVRVWDFLTVSWTMRGMLLLVFLLFYSRRRKEAFFPQRWSLAMLAAPVIMLHGFAFAEAMRLTGSAILINILSSMRGLVSVLVIFGLGLLKMGSYERMSGGLVIGRLAGSLLVCLSIYLAIGGMKPDADEANNPTTPAVVPQTVTAPAMPAIPAIPAIPDAPATPGTPGTPGTSAATTQEPAPDNASDNP